MTGYLNGYVIVNGPYDVLIIGPICQYNFIPTIQYSKCDNCFVVIEGKFAIMFDGF